ncbi:MAG: hypothetical protein V4538_02365 [Bacteroidota bacterium]
METKTIVLQTPGANTKSGGFSPLLFAVIIAVAGGSYYFYTKNKQEKSAQDAAGNIQGDDNTRLASQFKALIGDKWFGFPQRDKILELAKTVTDWKKVVDAYSLLNKGDNLEEDIRGILFPSQFEQFLINLNVKARQQNNNKTSVQQPVAAPKGLVKGVTQIKINNANNDVFGLKDRLNYGTGKNDIRFSKGANLAPVVFLDSVLHTYINGGKPFSVQLFKIALLSNKAEYWVREPDILKSSIPALKALEVDKYEPRFTVRVA